MNILEVCPRYPPAIGGVEEHVRQLVQRFAKQGHTVRILTTAAEMHPDAGQKSVDIVRYPTIAPNDAYFFSPGIERAVRRMAGDFDVIHAHNYHALPAFHAFRARGKTPFALTTHYHGTGHSVIRNAMHRPYRWLARSMVEGATRLICVSEPEARLLIHDFPRGRTPTIIPNGVDLQEFPTARRPKVIGQVVTVGRLERYKRIDVAMSALARVPGSRLVIVGDGPDRPRLEHLRSSLGRGHDIMITGRLSRQAVLNHLGESQVALCLSSKEAFGIGVLEALAAGTPVVASDIPAHREFAKLSGVVLLDDLSIPSITAAVAKAAELAPNRAELTAFDWENIAQRTMDVLGECA